MPLSKSVRSPKLSSSRAFGTALWLKSTGAHVRTKLRVSPCAKSRCGCPLKSHYAESTTNRDHLMNCAAFRPDHRAVLYRPQDGGRPYQHGPDVLLRGHADHEGVPADLEGPSQLIVAGKKTPGRRHSLQVLYNKDCVSDQAIIYWHQKGSKPQGRQHFLKATEGLVKVTSYYVPPSILPSC